MATPQWTPDNLLIIPEWTVVAQMMAETSGQTVTFLSEGYITLRHIWEYTGDISNFNTGQMLLTFTMQDSFGSPIQYRQDVSIQVDIAYWVENDQGEYVLTPSTSFTIFPNTDKASPASLMYTIPFDESYLVAQLDITFRCTKYFNQSLSNISLRRAKSNVDIIRQEINSSIANGLLSEVKFYDDGFSAAYESSQLAYKYVFQDGKLAAMVHQPSGFTVYIKHIGGNMP